MKSLASFLHPKIKIVSPNVFPSSKIKNSLNYAKKRTYWHAAFGILVLEENQ